VNTLIQISDYVGAAYKHKGDICSSIINEAQITIYVPATPVIVDPRAPTPEETVAKMIFKGEIDWYIKHKSMLDNPKGLFAGLGTMYQPASKQKHKLKYQAQWATLLQGQDVIALVNLIKTITFRSEDQKFLPLALYQAKANVYNLQQGNMNNHDYLQWFNNLVDVATAYNGQLYDRAIVDIVTERLHPGINYNALTDVQKEAVQTAYSDLYLATMFIHQSYRHRYGKLLEELENSFTKGNNNYPENLVSSYHLINEYKKWQPRNSTPEPMGVTFAQQAKEGDKNDLRHKDAICHNCKEKRHIHPNCPKLEDKDEDKEIDDTDSTKKKK
jgi:hypothetical protein